VKFVPVPLSPAAADASRGHDRSPLRELAVLVLTVGAIVAVLYLLAVLVVEGVVAGISPQTEARLFAGFADALPQPESLAPELERRRVRATELLAALQTNASVRTLPLRLRVWQTPLTNAVALPGGTIALTTGLLQSLDEDNAIAFVLAHELAHVKHRDHLRGLGRAVGFQVIRALVFSHADGVSLPAGQVGSLTLLAHSRRRESAADRFAVRLVHETFGHARDVGQLFTTLREDALPPWAYMFATHPATEERLRQIRGFAEELAAPASPP
jgi:Zn-dependent protease with chaperone function